MSRLRVGVLVGFTAILAAAVVLARHWDTGGIVRAQGKETLDLSQYTLTFAEEFDTLDVSAAGPGTRWTAHTPYGGDFGDARFADPEPGFPFTVENGVLRIEARKGQDGKWQSGLLSSLDPKGNGFKQALGYFEARAKMPDGPGVWPAFWLVGADMSGPFGEIDVIEYYGHANDEYQSVVHDWERHGKSNLSKGAATKVPPRSLTTDYNTFGVDIGTEWVTFFLNREVTFRMPTRPTYTKEMLVMVNLALGSGWPIDKTPNPSFMYVDYIRVYARK